MAIDDDYSQEEIKSMLHFLKEKQSISNSDSLSPEQKIKALNKLYNSAPLAYPKGKTKWECFRNYTKGPHEYPASNSELIGCRKELHNKTVDELKAMIKPSAGAALSSPAANRQPMSALPESKPPQTLAVKVACNDENATDHKNFISSAIKLYNQLSKHESGSSYKPGYVQPQVVEGGVKFNFSDAKQSLEFMQTLAQEKTSFFVLDKDKKVMAYSTGDGTLYKADGEPYAKGAKLESSNVTQADVEERLSENKSSSSMRR
jgi:hypothetical protein